MMTLFIFLTLIFEQIFVKDISETINRRILKFQTFCTKLWNNVQTKTDLKLSSKFPKSVQYLLVIDSKNKSFF